MTKPWLLIIPGLLLSACSNQAVYDNLQHNQLQECDRAPLSEYEACRERAGMSYEAYQRQRQQVLEDEAPRD